MAKARKCDRCGAFYTENKKNSKLSAVVKGVAIIRDTRDNSVDRSFDLCDTCMDAFLTFIYDFDPQPAEPEEPSEDGDADVNSNG